MTYNTNQPPYLFKRSFKNVQADTKDLLASGNCRGMLIAGALFATFAVAVSILLSFALIASVPVLMQDNMVTIANGVLFVSAAFFLIFFFPPIYCGMYNVALINHDGKNAEMFDLFKFYTSPYLYKRSINIFLRSSWLIYLLLLIVGTTSILEGLSSFLAENNIFKVVAQVISSILDIAIFVTIMFFFTRKFKFIYIPMAVEKTDIPVKQCVADSKMVSYTPFRMYFRFDTGKTFLLALASFFTVGILQIVYAGPLAVAKKVAYYKAFKID